MINWRTILGLTLLFFGVKELYTIVGNSSRSTPVYAEIGCVIWMAAGTFFIVKGLSKKPE